MSRMCVASGEAHVLVGEYVTVNPVTLMLLLLFLCLVQNPVNGMFCCYRLFTSGSREASPRHPGL